ncbi:MAG: hypothetical protein JKY80_04985, partial [Mariprofundaceae bacterium]|nr:hypothetical protein [Mariprofundaceae bacterium]
MVEQEIASVQLKMLGIEYVHMTENLIKGFSEHRGMTNVNFASPAMFRQALLQKTTQIDQLLVKNSRLNQLQEKRIPIPNDWVKHVTSRWIAIKKQQMDQLHQWQAHTEIIDLLIRHIRDVEEESSISFEEDPALHNLLAIQLEVMPTLLESIGKLRDHGTAFSANKVMSEDTKLLFGTMAGQVKMELETLKRVSRLPMALQDLEELRFLLASFRYQVDG